MKQFLFVIAVIGVWVASKIKLSEPPTVIYIPEDNGWYNPKLNVVEHDDGLEVELFNDGVLKDYFFVDNEKQLRDYLKQEYNANFYFE